MRKFLVFVMIAIPVCWGSYAYVENLNTSLSTWLPHIDGVATFFITIIGGLLMCVLALLAIIPGVTWILTLNNFPPDVTYLTLGGCAGAWGILTALERVKVSQLKQQQKFELKLLLWFVGLVVLVRLTNHFTGGDQFPVIIVLSCAGAFVLFLLLFSKDPSGVGGAARRAFRVISKAADSAFYFVLSPFFRSKVSYSRTNERRFTMSDPTNHPPSEEEASAERAYEEAKQKVDEQRKEAEAVFVEIEKVQPGLLSRPDMPGLGHKRILQNIRTKIETTTIMKNVAKRTIVLEQLNALQKIEITLIENERLAEEARTKLEYARKARGLVDDEIQVKIKKLEADRLKHQLDAAQSQAEIDKLTKPAPASRIQQKKDELEEAELDDKLNKLKKPATPPTPAERIERELAGFKDLEAWKNSWPADMSPEDKALRQSIYNAKYGAIKERIKT